MIGWPIVLGVLTCIGCVANGLRDTGLSERQDALRAGAWGALATASIAVGFALQVAQA